MWPGVPFRHYENGWRWPEVALCLCSLAPRLAPRSLVSCANVRTIKARGHLWFQWQLVRLNETLSCVCPWGSRWPGGVTLVRPMIVCPAAEPGRTRLRPAPAQVRKRQADQRPAVRLPVGTPRRPSPMGQNPAGQHALDTAHSLCLMTVLRLAPEPRAGCDFRLRRAVSCFYRSGS